MRSFMLIMNNKALMIQGTGRTGKVGCVIAIDKRMKPGVLECWKNTNL